MIVRILVIGWILAGVVAAAEPVVVTFGSLTATAPTDWTSEKPANRLRSHQFKLASGTMDLADAELTIMPESSKSVEKEFPRWQATVTPPDNKSIDDVSKISKFEAGPAKVHLLDVAGTWKYRAAPNDPKSKEVLKPDYRVVWAIVIHGDEATHLRLSGPKNVVDRHYASFEKWLKSMK